MQLLIDVQSLPSLKGSTLVPLRCQRCSVVFERQAKYIRSAIKRKLNWCLFCSKHCTYAARITSTTTPCGWCQTSVTRVLKEKQKSKSGFSLCDHSCSIRYSDAHKTKGYRRSKLEMWLEAELTKQFPTLEILFNRKDTINPELDIYIPSKKLAIEINGVFHYRPIYGEKKFLQTQANDRYKRQACRVEGIKLVVLDISHIKHFSPPEGGEVLQEIYKYIQ